jgi:tRNA1Val (adenine37-N6)-methyltransferase
LLRWILFLRRGLSGFMSNSWFAFKQFTIEQATVAMKVSTDACIQGAWAAAELRTEPNIRQILDIGTGTGLLSLMLAQQLSADITAIEINPEAAAQAASNFANSPWTERIRLFPDSLAAFISSAGGQFDFIICNPPFFHRQLRSHTTARNQARHSDTLSKKELAESLRLLLRDEGTCCIMYPQTEWDDWLRAAGGAGLFPHKQLHIHPAASKPANRMIGIFSKNENATTPVAHLVIYEADRSYTADFITLLQPYYLNL